MYIDTADVFAGYYLITHYRAEKRILIYCFGTVILALFIAVREIFEQRKYFNKAQEFIFEASEESFCGYLMHPLAFSIMSVGGGNIWTFLDRSVYYYFDHIVALLDVS